MKALPWWMYVAVVLLIVGGAFIQLWAYDGDIKCLFAECRRVK